MSNHQTELTQTDDADIAALEAEARDLTEDELRWIAAKICESRNG